MTKGQQNTFGRGKRGENEDQLEYPPLTSEIERQLDPSYVAFYNNDVRGRRKEDPLPFATGSIPPVSSSQDFSIERRSSEGPDIGLRRFVPPGTQPPSGWPLVLYFHGGGWVGGNLDTENALCRNICVQSRAVVVTVGYRLAPEDPYPAATQDAGEAFDWLTSPVGQEELRLDPHRVAVVGTSAGGNLAAVVTQKPRPQERRLCCQVLIVPAVDNTADADSNSTWETYWDAPQPGGKRMLSYRRQYLPDESTWSHREASPLLAPPEIFRSQPPTHMILAGVDVLRYEGEQYASRLEENGVSVKVEMFRKMPHPFIVMDGRLDECKQATNSLCQTLSKAFAAEPGSTIRLS